MNSRVALTAAALAAGLAVGLALAGCGGSSKSSSSASASTTGSTTISDHSSPPPSTTGPVSHTAPAPAATLARGFHLTSPVVRQNGPIPRRYTCDGADISLPLRFSGVPRATRELVLIMRDPDAPSGNFVHWALAGIPPRTTALQAGGVPGQIIPGRNSLGSLGYRGPCPPHGSHAHHYVITLNALSGRSSLRPGFTADQLQTAAIGVATLVGTYRRG
jgi:Raf kinase inhibitor-like YbhB/YbcL family protein